MIKRFLTATCVLYSMTIFAAENVRVNILDYKSLVKNPGTKQEDWQPAFQAAVKKAFELKKPLYVPAGNYPVWKTVTIWKKSPGEHLMGPLLLCKATGVLFQQFAR